MQLHQLKAFVCAADAGSLSAAARILGLTQPSLTRSLRQLEISVGASLMKRGVAGVVLTDTGLALLAHARQIVDEVQRAEEDVRQRSGDSGGLVRIASSAVPAQALLSDAVAMMRRDFPLVQLQISASVYPAVMSLFRTAAIDFAVGPLPPEGVGAEYKSEVILESCFVPVVRHGHPKAESKNLADLANIVWVAAGPTTGPGDACQRAFTIANLSLPTIAARSETVETALHLIIRSDWACFIPKSLAIDAAKRGIVSIVPVVGQLPKLEVSLFRPSKRILTPAAQALYSAIRSCSRSLQGSLNSP